MEQWQIMRILFLKVSLDKGDEKKKKVILFH